ncbi:hypothetical protein [Vibrio rotiferianus]|uniref:hypothetical protein n=1 Tax=Vibrio rotiferianus TaxID=190895 RepID=UPI0005EF8F56|nr:hypothetical protein [Vibrio rotiferianus]
MTDSKANHFSDEEQEGGLPDLKGGKKKKNSHKQLLVLILMTISALACVFYVVYVWLPEYQKNDTYEEAMSSPDVVEEIVKSNNSDESLFDLELVQPVDVSSQESFSDEEDSIAQPEGESHFYDGNNIENQLNVIIARLDAMDKRFLEFSQSFSDSESVRTATFKTIGSNQTKIFNAVSSVDNSVKEVGFAVTKMNKSVRASEKKLSSMSQNMKTQEHEFPIVVYSKGQWGNDEYLMIAPRDYPTQTKNLRVNEQVGDWTLIAITNRGAVFRNSKGKEKRVAI